ncbi:MAG: 50S ribosomal protein L9 [Eubacteriaceae bacterium]|nr:50S ribosomal protein L9 [Eubacteriaceae bacterium]
MKVILTQDIDSLGKAREVVNVKAGYANNFLIKKGFALAATDKNMASLNEEISRIEAENLRIKDEAEKLQSQINLKTIKITQAEGPDGKLYGSVTSKDIAEAIMSEHSVLVDKRKITVEPIKQAGTYTLSIKLHPEVEAEVYLIVSSKQ